MQADISADRCPLCGGPNGCARAACPDNPGDCWCEHVLIAPEIIERIPAEARGRACVCRRCVEEGRSPP